MLHTFLCSSGYFSLSLSFNILRFSIFHSLDFQIVFCRHSTKCSAQKITGCDKLISFVHSNDLCLPCLYNTVIYYNMHVFNFHDVFLLSENPPLPNAHFLDFDPIFAFPIEMCCSTKFYTAKGVFFQLICCYMIFVVQRAQRT